MSHVCWATTILDYIIPTLDGMVSNAGADPEKNLTGFQPLIIISYTDTCIYIYGNFLRDLNIREFLILVLFVKSTVFNIKTKTLPYLGLTDVVTELWNVTF